MTQMTTQSGNNNLAGVIFVDENAEAPGVR